MLGRKIQKGKVRGWKAWGMVVVGGLFYVIIWYEVTRLISKIN